MHRFFHVISARVLVAIRRFMAFYLKCRVCTSKDRQHTLHCWLFDLTRLFIERSIHSTLRPLVHATPLVVGKSRPYWTNAFTEPRSYLRCHGTTTVLEDLPRPQTRPCFKPSYIVFIITLNRLWSINIMLSKIYTL